MSQATRTRRVLSTVVALLITVAVIVLVRLGLNELFGRQESKNDIVWAVIVILILIGIVHFFTRKDKKSRN